MPTTEARPPEVLTRDAVPHGGRSLVRRALKFAANFCTAIVAIGLVDRFTVRDSIDLLAPVFYGLPPAVLTVLALAASILFTANRNRTLALVLSVVTVGCAALWARTEFRTHSASSTAGDSTVMFWNAATNFWPTPGLQQLQQPKADIIGMVEAGDGRATLEWYAEKFPEYQFAHFGHGIVCGSRAPITHRELGRLNNFGKYALVETELSGEPVTVIIVDMKSNPFRTRRNAFAALNELIDRLDSRRLIVMGDFNTPGDSVYFDSLRGKFNDAFESAGSGPSSTWPLPVPVLALDHIWLGPQFEVHQAELGWSPTSDHRPVIARVARK